MKLAIKSLFGIRLQNRPGAFAAPRIRRAVPSDAASCGRVMYEAFRTVADRHGFPPDFPSAVAAIEFVEFATSVPNIFGVVAEVEGNVVGSNFLWERDPIRGLGPVAVVPRYQGHGLGRQLMAVVLERAQGAPGIRLIQEAFNVCSIALYASLGFVVREHLLLLQGTPKCKMVVGTTVRALTEADVGPCEMIAQNVLGHGRGGQLRSALKNHSPFVVERDGRIRGYMTAPNFGPANHAAAETDEDMRTLIVGAAPSTGEPLSLILPTSQAELFRWCLSQNFRIVKPLTLMTIGDYETPHGVYFPSAIY